MPLEAAEPTPWWTQDEHFHFENAQAPAIATLHHALAHCASVRLEVWSRGMRTLLWWRDWQRDEELGRILGRLAAVPGWRVGKRNLLVRKPIGHLARITLCDKDGNTLWWLTSYGDHNRALGDIARLWVADAGPDKGRNLLNFFPFPDCPWEELEYDDDSRDVQQQQMPAYFFTGSSLYQ